jgi:uncharacterized protein YyaL (SSP411 family)
MRPDDDVKPLPTDDEIKALPPDGGPDYNRLIFQRSPYLLQHARNPVDWYPWGEEAFERALREDKPVFLSIGYSTCHWCHVMERESFEDAAVARLMNDSFVCVKVDREERPDIDGVYMSACQAMTGGGGWPLTVIMTPDGRPLFAGTYIPKESIFGRPGMLELIPRAASLWADRREDLLRSAEGITEALRGARRASAGEDLGAESLGAAFEGLASRYDAARGGFGEAPKFPTPHNLLFLLRYWRRSGDDRALAMVEGTLKAMRRGGIFDHVGLGFHRYSTDPEWLVPHFEKMLYDQAMLAMAYVEAHQATGAGEYARTAREIFEYVLRDMTSSAGGFCSAEDADSEGEEGKYYLWTKGEVLDVLGPEEGEVIARLFNIHEGGNFASEAGAAGLNIPHLRAPGAARAAEVARLAPGRVEEARLALLGARGRRIRPAMDDKVLADWNGLMIAALAKGAAALDEPRYAEAASKAAGFVLARMRAGDGRLLHSSRGERAGVRAFLDDYAFLIWGLLELYEATFEAAHLREALDLAGDMIDGFWDERGGGFFVCARDSEELIVRRKEIYDGAVPSGNSVAALVLLRLARATADPDLERKAAETMRSFSGEISTAPSAYTQMMAALDFALGPTYEVVIAGGAGEDPQGEMAAALRRAFVPNKVVLFKPAGAGAADIVKLAKFVEGHGPVDGATAAYVCVDYACKRPTSDPAEMLRLLGVRSRAER